MTAANRQQLLRWRTVSYILSLLILCFQQVGLMNYMYRSQSWALYLAVFDVICVCNWIFYTSPKMVGIRGANCWIIYSRVMTVKVIVFYYIVLPEFLPREGLLFGSACGAATEILILLLLTPTLYVLTSFRAGVHLYGDMSCISSERLIHTDLIIHVTFDLLDVIDMCHVYLTIPSVFEYRNYITDALCGVLIATGIFLHSYSFPRMSETSRAKGTIGFKGGALYSASDVYYCRKYAAIVGIFFVDVPFAIFRSVLWMLLVNHTMFGPFLLKNICFIIIQAARIRHCTIGIRTLDYSKTLTEYKEEERRPILVTDIVLDDDRPSGVGELHEGREGSRSEQRKSFVRFNTKPEKVDEKDPKDQPATGQNTTDSATDDEGTFTGITIPEGFSVKAVNFRALFKKIVMAISVGSKCEMAHLLDSTLQLSLWQNAIIAIPHIVLWAVEVTIVIAFYRLDLQSTAQYVDLFHFRGLLSVSFYRLPLCLQFTPCLIVAASLVSLVCWIMVGPLIGALFVAFQVFVSLVSFSFVLLSLSEFIPALRILAFISEHTMGTPRDYLFFMFGVRPFLNLLSGLYPFLCLTLGKHYIYYINPSLVSTEGADLLGESVKLISGTFAVNKEGLVQDESFPISLASLLVLTNAVIMCAPPSSHSLLIGPNLIKAIRLDRALANSHKNAFMRTCMIRLYCILMVVGNNGREYSCAIVFYIVHMLMIPLYGLLSKGVRRSNIEAVHQQAMCADILRETRIHRTRYNRLLTYERAHVNTTPLGENHWIFKKYQRNMMFL
ncbi:membrane protein, putative [Babesia bigemina]|uniref:Membrane protein, putative n=1 Tax=Babesia bigemina TaxID=5866 RepID=A0A061DC24_BABBI|nr:membrane protein, putative [Babesia bigemina]CDR96469.1 membrane protein, putative [Babesia bigemina]|eukprot:XP_012768655.1 membrane protein, putative [Babesia bigemina]